MNLTVRFTAGLSLKRSQVQYTHGGSVLRSAPHQGGHDAVVRAESVEVDDNGGIILIVNKEWRIRHIPATSTEIRHTQVEANDAEDESADAEKQV